MVTTIPVKKVSQLRFFVPAFLSVISNLFDVSSVVLLRTALCSFFFSPISSFSAYRLWAELTDCQQIVFENTVFRLFFFLSWIHQITKFLPWSGTSTMLLYNLQLSALQFAFVVHPLQIFLHQLSNKKRQKKLKEENQTAVGKDTVICKGRKENERQRKVKKKNWSRKQKIRNDCGDRD